MFSNCVPVPFDEDDKDDSVWFLDHDYLENMYGMFKKVNGKIHCLTMHMSITNGTNCYVIVIGHDFICQV